MFQRSPPTHDTHLQDLPGQLLHGIATLIIVCAGPLLSELLTSPVYSAEIARRPNVVLILADDKY